MDRESIMLFVNNYDGPREILAEILSIFIQETPERLEIIETASREQNYEAVAKTAHSLANSAGTLDLTSTLENCRNLEAAARNGEGENAETVFTGIKSDLRRIVEEAEGVLAGLKKS
ncbi:MAG: Hpt domain-containing protein [Spirochaetia bacterium]